MKKASFFGSVARIADSHSTAVAIASSHSISRNTPEPRSPTRFNGLRSFAGDCCCMMPGGALAANHPTVDRMIAVAFDVADAAILQMDFDPAAAGAHIAGRAFDLVGYFGRGIDDFARREIVADALGKAHPALGSDEPGSVCCFVLTPSSFLSDAVRGRAGDGPKPAASFRRETAPGQHNTDHSRLQHHLAQPERLPTWLSPGAIAAGFPDDDRLDDRLVGNLLGIHRVMGDAGLPAHLKAERGGALSPIINRSSSAESSVSASEPWPPSQRNAIILHSERIDRPPLVMARR